MREELEREYVEYLQVQLPRLRRLAALLTGDRDGPVHERRMLVRTFLGELRRPWSRTWRCCWASPKAR